MRLSEWRLAPDGTTFSYGGDEVELSLWDVESAFSPKRQPQSQPQRQLASPKKRKRGGELLPGELWRAKNVRIHVIPVHKCPSRSRFVRLIVAQVANDSLSLRQPVHNTCLAYLSPTSHHLLAGTQRGDLRRYDTRAARKPVAEWKQIVPAAGSNSGIGGVEKGFHEQYVQTVTRLSTRHLIMTPPARSLSRIRRVTCSL